MGFNEGLAGDNWELTATDEHEDGLELVQVVRPASHGLVHSAQQPEDQPGHWGEGGVWSRRGIVPGDS